MLPVYAVSQRCLDFEERVLGLLISKLARIAPEDARLEGIPKKEAPIILVWTGKL